jgi:hypothetical protein
MQLTTRLRRVQRLRMSGAVPRFFRVPTWYVDIWPLPLPSWVAVTMREGLEGECAWNALRNYHVIWLQNLENQGNKLRIISLRGRFLTLDLKKTKQGWHRVDRNERWTVLLKHLLGYAVLSSVLRCLLMNVAFMNGVCFAGGLGLISRKLCYVTRED